MSADYDCIAPALAGDSVASQIESCFIESDVSVGKNSSFDIAEVSVTITDDDASEETVEGYAAKMTTLNEDGSITITSITNIDVDGDSVSVVNPMLRSTGYSGGYKIVQNATYYSVSLLPNYSGYGYRPVSSKYTISKNTSSAGSISYCLMEVVLSGNSYTADEPYTYVESLVDYYHCYETSSPLLDYEYSFDDYNKFISDTYEWGGFRGQMIQVVNNTLGCYKMNTYFEIGSTAYNVEWKIAG